MNETTIDVAITKLKLKVKPKKGEAALSAKVRTLTQHFDGKSGSECSNCHAESTTDDFEVCPFCGVGEEQDPGDEAPASEEVVDDLKPSSALAPPEAVVHEGILEYPPAPPDLDRAVEEIKELQREQTRATWKLVVKVAVLGKSQLWKLRRDGTGKPAYRTFEQFANAELGMSKRYATDLILIHGQSNEEQFREFGPTKLRLVFAAPKEQQAELIEQIKGGAGKRELEQAIGRKSDVKEHDTRTKEGKAALADKERKTVTIASIEGKKSFDLFTKESIGKDEKVPARKITDFPYGYVDMTNHVRLWFTILQKPGGELYGRIQVKRLDD